jgi:hypothetical protein
MPGLYEYSLLKETHSFPFLYRTNFSEGSDNIAKGERGGGSLQVSGDSSRNSLQTTATLDFTIVSRRKYKTQINWSSGANCGIWEHKDPKGYFFL